jgi:hypothetical protein
MREWWNKRIIKGSQIDAELHSEGYSYVGTEKWKKIVEAEALWMQYCYETNDTVYYTDFRRAWYPATGVPIQARKMKERTFNGSEVVRYKQCAVFNEKPKTPLPI